MSNKIVMLVLWRRLISDLLIDKLTENPDVKAFCIPDFSEARSAAISYQPHLALVEIPHRWYDKPVLDAFEVCNIIHEEIPTCKIVLQCPENDTESVQFCIDAKKQGKIEDFLFYNSSVDHLVSKLKALYQTL